MTEINKYNIWSLMIVCFVSGCIAMIFLFGTNGAVFIKDSDWQCSKWENTTDMPYACHYDETCTYYAKFFNETGVVDENFWILTCPCAYSENIIYVSDYVNVPKNCCVTKIINYPQCQVCTQPEKKCIEKAIYKIVDKHE
jgi:hypothetical protein